MNSKTLITKEQVLAKEEELIQAIQNNDLNALDDMLHEDLLFMIPNGEVITKSMDMDSHRARAMVVEKIEPTIEALNLIEDTAVVIILLDTKGKMLGQPIEGKFRYVRVWKLFGESLKVIGGSCMQVES